LTGTAQIRHFCGNRHAVPDDHTTFDRPVDFAFSEEQTPAHVSREGRKLHDQPCAIVAVDHGCIHGLPAMRADDAHQIGRAASGIGKRKSHV